MSLVDGGERQPRDQRAQQGLDTPTGQHSYIPCALCGERWRRVNSTMCDVCDLWVERIEDERAAPATTVPRWRPAAEISDQLSSLRQRPRATDLSGRRWCIRCGCRTNGCTSRGYCTGCHGLWLADRLAAIAWARAGIRRWYEQRDWVILDTETTGLDSTAQVVEIAVLAPSGAVLLDSLVQPTGPIPADATRIHQITDQMVARAPTFRELYPGLARLLRGRTVAVYNASYDQRIIQHELQRARLPSLGLLEWTCAMHEQARFAGEWNPSFNSYRWPRLAGGDHSALGDCRATLSLLKNMAGADVGVVEDRIVERRYYSLLEV